MRIMDFREEVAQLRTENHALRAENARLIDQRDRERTLRIAAEALAKSCDQQADNLAKEVVACEDEITRLRAALGVGPESGEDI